MAEPLTRTELLDAPAAGHRRIDVHAHYIPNAYREAAVAAGHAQPDGMPALPPWSPEIALRAMDAAGIETAMLSISSPGIHFGDDRAARELARVVNDEGARLVAATGRRFGLLAALPLPDVDGALIEIAHALDGLKADGVTVLTNARGGYLADPQFAPVLADLDRRAAVVFMHPTSPACTCTTTPGGLPYPRPMLEFMFETTRAVSHLILSGALDRHPRIRWIIPHAGAALPVLADRVQGFSAFTAAASGGVAVDVMGHLRRLHYDVAGMSLPRQLPALQSFADPQRIFYGSDWPFTPSPLVERLAGALDAFLVGDSEAHGRVVRRNAEALFPRLARIT